MVCGNSLYEYRSVWELLSVWSVVVVALGSQSIWVVDVGVTGSCDVELLWCFGFAVCRSRGVRKL